MKPLSKAILKRCDEVSEIFAGLSHPVRLKILCMLMEGDRCVADLTDFCEISQPAMSQFLLRMKNEGLLKSRREGTRIYYQLVDKRLSQLLKATKSIYC